MIGSGFPGGVFLLGGLDSMGRQWVGNFLKGYKMSNTRAVIGSVIGAALGFAAWVAIAYFANYEIGWIAWGIGLLAGMGYAAGQGVGGAVGGVTAAVVSVLAIISAKAVVVQLQVNDGFGLTEYVQMLEEDEPLTISYLADGVVEQYMEEGKPLSWPPNADLEYPESAEDYPSDVWAEASGQWSGMSQDEQAAFRATTAENIVADMEAVQGEVAMSWFKESFGMMDILFFGFAIVTAFKVGSGSGAETE